MARRARGGRRGEIARATPEEFGAETADEAQEAPRQILGPTMEAMLRAELDAHLGYASNGRSPKATANRRDGYAPKRARTSAGELEISVPRDRDGSFEPVYAFVSVDCLHVPARDGRGARDAAVCAVPAYDPCGRKDVPGPWVGDPEGAHRWMQAFDELGARGAEDVLHVSSDGVAGLGEGLGAVFPAATHRRCVVRLVRNSLGCVPRKGAAAFCRSVRAVCGAPSPASAESAWDASRGERSRYPGAVAVWGRSLDQAWRLFSCGSEAGRVTCTTNALESVDASFRKVVRRGPFPGEEAVMKPPYPRVLEPYRKWGEGCRHAGWSQVRNQLPCDEGMRPRIEGCL